MLYGRWDIRKAERNGRETTYLRGGYFIMDKNGSMTVNLTGQEEKGPYDLHDRILLMNETQEYLIEAQAADSLRIRYIRGPGNEFLFYLYKNHDDH